MKTPIVGTRLDGAERLALLLESAANLTLPASEAVAYGPFTDAEIRTQFAPYPYPRRTSVFEVNIHTLTHFDLPWAIDMEIWQQLVSQHPSYGIDLPPSGGEAERLIRSMAQPKIVNCLVVDLTHMRHEVSKMRPTFARLDAQGWQGDGEQYGVVDSLVQSELVEVKSETAYIELLLQLRIDPDLLQAAIDAYLAAGGIAEVGSSLVLFKTGWDFFKPRYRNIGHPYFNCAHPYALHPYLDERGLEVILNAGFGGIAADTIGLDCPAYDLVETFRPDLAGAKQAIFSGELGNRLRLPRDPRFRICHVSLLSRRLHYIKNLHFPFLDEMGRSPSDLLRFDGDPVAAALEWESGLAFVLSDATFSGCMDAQPVNVFLWTSPED